jgi:hypothetical protein
MPTLETWDGAFREAGETNPNMLPGRDMPLSSSLA